MAVTNKQATFWCAAAICAALLIMAVIALGVARDAIHQVEQLRTTSQPVLYTVTELGPLDHYRQRSSVTIASGDGRNIHIPLNSSKTRVHKVGAQILARVPPADSPHAGTGLPEDVVQAGFWHWYGPVIWLTLIGLGVLLAGVLQLRRKPGS